MSNVVIYNVCIRMYVYVCVCGVLIQEVLHRDDGGVYGVSTLNDFGVVQLYVLDEVSIHT